MYRILLILILLATWPAWAEDEPGYYVVTYAPGADWDGKLDFDSQPGMKAHRDYVARLHEDDVVLMAGPLVDVPGAMMLVRAGSLAEANKIAADDPAVMRKLLTAKVTGWHVEVTSMRQYKRVIPTVQSPDKPFRIERIGPEAPINLEPDKKK